MTLILPSDGVFQEPFPPTRFTFESKTRMRFPVRPDRRGKRIYWYIRKQLRGVLHHVYIAPQGKLSHELLENAATQIESQAVQS